MCDCNKCNPKKTPLTDCMVILGFLIMGAYLGYTVISGESFDSHSVEVHSKATHSHE